MPGKDRPQPPMNPDDDMAAFDQLFRPASNDPVLAVPSYDLDPALAAQILQRFGKIPEFARWETEKFRMAENHIREPENPWFRIESETRGSIDYVLLREEDRSIARRRIAAGLPEVEISYWSGNYQKRYQMSVSQGEVGLVHVAVNYTKDPHEIAELETAPLVHMTYVLRSDIGPYMQLVMPSEMREDVERRAQREDQLGMVDTQSIRVMSLPTRVILGSIESRELPPRLWVPGASAEYGLNWEEFEQNESKLITLRQARHVDGRVESITFTKPDEVVAGALADGALAPEAQWTQFDKLIEVNFDDQEPHQALEGK